MPDRSFEAVRSLKIRSTDREKLDSLELSENQRKYAEAWIILGIIIIDEITAGESENLSKEEIDFNVWRKMHDEFTLVTQVYLDVSLTLDENEAETFRTKIRENFSYFKPKIMSMLLKNLV